MTSNLAPRRHHRPVPEGSAAAAETVETAPRESAARFRAVWEATSEAMALSDPAGVVLAVNTAYCALYGFPEEALIGQNFAVIFPEATRAAALQQYQAIFADPAPPQRYEAHVQRSDGTTRWSRPGRTFSAATGHGWR